MYNDEKIQAVLPFVDAPEGKIEAFNDWLHTFIAPLSPEALEGYDHNVDMKRLPKSLEEWVALDNWLLLSRMETMAELGKWDIYIRFTEDGKLPTPRILWYTEGMRNPEAEMLFKQLFKAQLRMAKKSMFIEDDSHKYESESRSNPRKRYLSIMFRRERKLINDGLGPLSRFHNSSFSTKPVSSWYQLLSVIFYGYHVTRFPQDYSVELFQHWMRLYWSHLGSSPTRSSGSIVDLPVIHPLKRVQMHPALKMCMTFSHTGIKCVYNNKQLRWRNTTEELTSFVKWITTLPQDKKTVIVWLWKSADVSRLREMLTKVCHITTHREQVIGDNVWIVTEDLCFTIRVSTRKTSDIYPIALESDQINILFKDAESILGNIIEDCDTLSMFNSRLSQLEKLIYSKLHSTLHSSVIVTLPSLGYHIFRIPSIFYKTKPLIQTWSLQTDSLEIKSAPKAAMNILSYATYSSYYSGVSQVYRVYGEHLYMYDVNSLYTHMMKHQHMPVDYPRFVSHFPSGASWRSFYGLVFARITTSSTICSLPVRIGESAFYPQGSFLGWYFSSELKQMESLGYHVVPLCGWKFGRGKVFSKYINYLLNSLSPQRSTWRKRLTKLLINTLYGKLASRSDTTHFNNRLLSAAITSEARQWMNQFYHKFDQYLYYTNTDSLVLNVPLSSLSPEICGADVGQFRLVHYIRAGLFLSPKVYLLLLPGDILKITYASRPPLLISSALPLFHLIRDTILSPPRPDAEFTSSVRLSASTTYSYTIDPSIPSFTLHHEYNYPFHLSTSSRIPLYLSTHLIGTMAPIIMSSSQTSPSSFIHLTLHHTIPSQCGLKLLTAPSPLLCLPAPSPSLSSVTLFI